MRSWTIGLFFFLTFAAGLRADQFDALRLYWQTNLISNGGSISSITNDANSDWNSMETSPNPMLPPSTIRSRVKSWARAPVSPKNVGSTQAMANMAKKMNTPVTEVMAAASHCWPGRA